jgi:hypothetical protein
MRNVASKPSLVSLALDARDGHAMVRCDLRARY